MLQKVAAVVQDLQDEKEGRRLSEQILPQAEAFQVAPAMRGQVTARSGPATMFSEGDIGVLPPLGVYDPLGLIDVSSRPAARSPPRAPRYPARAPAAPARRIAPPPSHRA